jgi:hypothetical protein
MAPIPNEGYAEVGYAGKSPMRAYVRARLGPPAQGVAGSACLIFAPKKLSAHELEFPSIFSAIPLT